MFKCRIISLKFFSFFVTIILTELYANETKKRKKNPEIGKNCSTKVIIAEKQSYNTVSIFFSFFNACFSFEVWQEGLKIKTSKICRFPVLSLNLKVKKMVNTYIVFEFGLFFGESIEAAMKEKNRRKET